VTYLILINLHKSPAERDRLTEIQVRPRSPTPSSTPHGTMFHTDNVKDRFSSTTEQVALNLPGVGVHCYPYNHGDMIENTGHSTKNHHFVHTVTGNPIKFQKYLSYVILTVDLGEWTDEVSWKNTQNTVTDLFLNKYTG
jgi:hypothetical protein